MTGTRAAASSRGSLPVELTSFVGRRRELVETRRLLASSRLLTLTGPGGVGKTRLAMRVAAEVRRAFPDGVWFVELAAVQDPQLVAQTLASALELRQVSTTPAADLAAYLEEKHLLVVLDNCEHLVDACAVLVSKLLAASPGLRVLATSRHLLDVEGEQILVVPPLTTPSPDGEVGAGDASHYESVALFLDRAAAVAPGFAIGAANRAAVLELCQRLDGIPLAIELAAVWLRTLSPAQILDRLEDRFRLLTPGAHAVPDRQRTLDTAIGWSFDLCSPAEQVMWTRLSVFSGGFDLDAAEEVCSGDGIGRDEVLSLVAGLVNKSIITRQPATEQTTAWYVMLETVRQYGAAQITDPGRRRALRTRHRDHYQKLAQRAAEETFSPRQADWFVRLRREHGNVRAALEFCLEDPREAEAALDIAASMWNFWFAGFLREGSRYLNRALELATEPTRSRAYGLWAAAYLAMFATEFERTTVMLAECSDLAERLDDDLLRARIKECRGHATLYLGDLPGAVTLLEEACTGFRGVGDPLGEFDSLVLLGATTLLLDDPRVEDFSRQALELAERHGATSSRGYGLWTVGIMHWRAGRIDEAARALRESIRLFQPMHDLTGISFGVQALSWCAASSAPPERAAQLLGASQAVWRTSGAKVDETKAYGMFDQRAMTRVQEVLGEERFEAALSEGRGYSFEQAVALALGEDAEPEQRTPIGGATSGPRRRSDAPGGLTRRELEIAHLLAKGLSNKEIAARLVIAQRTAETHVDHILGKLGLSSRTQVAGWVAEHGAH